MNPIVESVVIETRLVRIANELNEITNAIRTNNELPHPTETLAVGVALNTARTALVATDTALHARHNERHPIPKDAWREAMLSPTQPLDPETRAAIDDTP